jgi:hypothetical protein
MEPYVDPEKIAAQISCRPLVRQEATQSVPYSERSKSAMQGLPNALSREPYVDPSKLQAEISCRSSKPKATPPRPGSSRGTRGSMETGTVIEVGQVAKIYTDVDMNQPTRKKRLQTGQKSSNGTREGPSPRKLVGKALNLEEQFQKHYQPNDANGLNDGPTAEGGGDMYDDADDEKTSPYALYAWQDGEDCEAKMQRRRDELLMFDDIETREVRAPCVLARLYAAMNIAHTKALMYAHAYTSTRTRAFHAHTHTHTHTHSLTHSVLRTLAHAHTHTRSLTLSYARSHTHSRRISSTSGLHFSLPVKPSCKTGTTSSHPTV